MTLSTTERAIFYSNTDIGPRWLWKPLNRFTGKSEEKRGEFYVWLFYINHNQKWVW